jgi:CRP/FNR family transcriptional regulator, cyclic AMP receptor protein
LSQFFCTITGRAKIGPVTVIAPDDALRFLGQYGWLGQTSPSFREAVLTRCIVRNFDRNTDIYHVGDEPGGLWGLADGALLAHFPGSDEIPMMVHYARPGFWTGEGSVITGGNRFVGLRTPRPSTLLRLTRSAFLGIAATDPQAWRFLALLSLEHTVTLMNHTMDLRITSSRRKVATVLHRMGSPESGPATETGGPVEIDITQDQLADFCAMSRAAMAEVLREFAAAGVITPAYRRLTLTDRVALAAIATSKA